MALSRRGPVVQGKPRRSLLSCMAGPPNEAALATIFMLGAATVRRKARRSKGIHRRARRAEWGRSAEAIKPFDSLREVNYDPMMVRRQTYMGGGGSYVKTSGGSRKCGAPARNRTDKGLVLETGPSDLSRRYIRGRRLTSSRCVNYGGIARLCADQSGLTSRSTTLLVIRLYVQVTVTFIIAPKPFENLASFSTIVTIPDFGKSSPRLNIPNANHGHFGEPKRAPLHSLGF